MVDGSDPEYVVKCAAKWGEAYLSQVEVWEGKVLLLDAFLDKAYRFKWYVKERGLKTALNREAKARFGIGDRSRGYNVGDIRTMLIAGVIVRRALGDWRQWETFYNYLMASDEFASFRRAECKTVSEWRMSRAEVFATVIEVNGNLRRLA